ncbi:MAG TPA: DUF4198 domain-containing protein [Bryobacteraceae bacterium]|nr:DUF4198 domain-containing protein [Bryobacteraceae bacterium]
MPNSTTFPTRNRPFNNLSIHASNRIFRLLIASMFATATFAHDLYILPQSFGVEAGARVTVGFHNGDSFPESEVAPTIARLKTAQLLSAFGGVPIDDLKVEGNRATGVVMVPDHKGTMILSVETVPNFIELEPEKFIEYLKEEGMEHVIEWRSQHGEASKPGRERYSKFAKSLITSGSPDEFYNHTFGFPIEIIPDANPAALRAGRELPVRIMFRGKPASNLQVEAAWATAEQKKTTVIGRTDANGRIRVPINAAGKWRLHSLVMERCQEPAAADWESFWASLTFEIR